MWRECSIAAKMHERHNSWEFLSPLAKMVVDDSLEHPIAAVRCSLQQVSCKVCSRAPCIDQPIHRWCQGFHMQPAGVKERNERPQKRHRLSTDPSAVTLRVADSKPVSVTTGDARATLNLKADENDSRAGVQLSTYFETKVCVHPGPMWVSQLLTLLGFVKLGCRP